MIFAQDDLGSRSGTPRIDVASGRVARRPARKNGQPKRIRKGVASAKQGGEAQVRTGKEVLDRSTDMIHNETRSRMDDWQNVVLRRSQEPGPPKISEPNARLQV